MVVEAYNILWTLKTQLTQMQCYLHGLNNPSGMTE